MREIHRLQPCRVHIGLSRLSHNLAHIKEVAFLEGRLLSSQSEQFEKTFKKF